jgi:hypothetical protein
METAIAMGFAVDDVLEMPSPTETGEVEFHSWREWDDPFTTLQARADESDAVNAYLAEQAARVYRAVARVADGGTALIVGHGGWIESVVARLVDPGQASRVGGSFWHLDGIRLSVSTTSSVSVEAVERHPR